MGFKNIKQFNEFKVWCKKNGLKPSHAESLHRYVKEVAK